MTEHDARTKCDELVKELKETVGGEWIPNVWDNLGWFYCADLDNMSVWERNGKYSTSFSNDTNKHATPMYWSIVHDEFSSPREAVLKQLEIAKEHIQQCVNVVINQEILFDKLVEEEHVD